MKISFFFPSNKVGGVEYLYARLAEEIIKLKYHVEIIDYHDGTIKELLIKKNIDFIFTEYNKQKIKPKGDVCITSLLYLPYANNIFFGETKFLFWDDHPYNLILYLKHLRLIDLINLDFYMNLSRILKRRKYVYAKQLINTAIEKKGLTFMCGHNYLVNKKFFKLKLQPVFLPIIISVKEPKCNLNFPKYIDCSYLGRLDHDKYILCSELIDDIIHYNSESDIKIRLHIIGDGNRIEDLKSKTKNYEEYFIYNGVLKDNELNEFLSQKINLSFAVGTSALETAILGIPTLFMRDICTIKFTGKYIWVFDSFQFDLSLTDTNTKSMYIKEIISEYLKDKESLSKKCYNYSYNNHSINKVVELFLERINQTELGIADL